MAGVGIVPTMRKLEGERVRETDIVRERERERETDIV